MNREQRNEKNGGRMKKNSKSTRALVERVDRFVDEIFPELVRFRRDLHRHPEIAWEEHCTTEKIVRFLELNQYTEISRPLPTGLYADFVTGRQQLPFLAIRADIDALAIPDSKAVEYRSQQPGISHACGHDVHTAVVCGVAQVLRRFSRDVPVNVRLVFQPAEEPIPSGAPKMIEAGVLNGVRAMLGLHVETRLPLGTIGLADGWVNAQSIRLDWEIRGRGGHSARPEEAIDPIVAGIKVIRMARGIARERWYKNDPRVILQFTRFESSGAYNAIPESAFLTATLRLVDTGLRDRVLDELDRLNSEVTSQTGAGIKLVKIVGAPPVFNHPDLLDKMYQIWNSAKIPGTMVDKEYRSMGGDDFSWYGQHVPVAMVRFGTNRANDQYQAHSRLFDVPERVITIAVKFLLRQILFWKTGGGTIQ